MRSAPAIAGAPFQVSRWLDSFLRGLGSGKGAQVDCGGCVGCCSARHFVLVEAGERARIERLRPGVLVPFPGGPAGSTLIPYDRRGRCAFLGEGGCSIYSARPRTCRIFDCRILSAAGLRADLPGQAPIDRAARARRPEARAERDARALSALREAVRFLRENPGLFPGGRIPQRPEQVAAVAAKAHAEFLPDAPARTPLGRARAVVRAVRRFDAGDPT